MLITFVPSGQISRAGDAYDVQGIGSPDLVQLLQSSLNLLQKIVALSNDQIRTLIMIGENWSKLEMLTTAQKDLLAQKGITTGEDGDLTVVLAAIKSRIHTDDQINNFRAAVEQENLFDLYVLYSGILEAVPVSLKTALTAKGLTFEQLLGVIVDFTTLTFNQGMEINSMLKNDVDWILTQNGIYDAVDKAVLSRYGLNWENLNTLIGQLTPDQKTDLEAILEAFGQYIRAPQASPAAGTYWSPQNITLQSPTAGAAVLYVVNGDVLDDTGNLSSEVQVYTSPVSVNTPGTTTLTTVAVKDGVKSVMASYTYILNLLAAPQASPAPGIFTTPQTLILSSATPGTTIYYTTDGSDPLSSATKKTGPGTGTEAAMDQTGILRAVAVIEGINGAVSGEFSGLYAIDAGTFSLDQAGYEVAENAGKVTITVNRAGPAESEVKVSYTTESVTAVAPGDYQEVAGSLTFPQGTTTQSFDVLVQDDHLVEGPETFTVKLSGTSGGGILGEQKTTLVTITDDDQPGKLSFDQAEYSVTENPGTVAIKVLRTGGSDDTVKVDYTAAAGTAGAGTDFLATSGTLTFNPGVRADLRDQHP